MSCVSLGVKRTALDWLASDPRISYTATGTMGRISRLNGVAHDIGHHAQSGLSWLYPHLGEACQQASVLSASVNLLSPVPYPDGLPRDERLAGAMAALRETLARILTKEGFELADLSEARLEFIFPPGYGDHCTYGVRSLLIARGRRFERLLPMIGETRETP